MAKGLIVDFDVNEKDLAKISKYPEKYKVGLRRGVKKVGVELERRAKNDFTKSRSGAGGLHVRSGALRRNIRHNVRKIGNKYTISLYNRLIYAGIHEFGGVIKAKSGGYLKFKVGNQWVSKKQVKIPKRPFLEPAIRDSIKDRSINKIIMKEISKSMEK